MKMFMYVIFDNKAKMYNKPFCMLNDQVAIRAGQDLVNDHSTECSKNPQDFALFLIAEYDDETAEIKPFDKQICLIRFHELIQAQHTQERRDLRAIEENQQKLDQELTG